MLFSIANATILSCATTEFIFPYGVVEMEEIRTGDAGLEKFTMSSLAPMLLAIYKRSTSSSNATISAEFVPAVPLEKLVKSVKFNAFDGEGAW